MNNFLWYLQGVGVMVLLGLCSITVVAVIIERAIRLRRSAIIDPRVVEDIQMHLEQGKIDLAVQRHEFSPSLTGRILSKGLKEHQHTSADIETAMLEAGERHLPVLQNNLSVLALIAKVAPLLGLLGTVLGMIIGFAELEKEGVGKEALAGAIRLALMTTAFGLLVAIPAIVALSWFRSKIRRIHAELEEIFIDVIKTVKTSSVSTPQASPEEVTT